MKDKASAAAGAAGAAAKKAAAATAEKAAQVKAAAQEKAAEMEKTRASQAAAKKIADAERDATAAQAKAERDIAEAKAAEEKAEKDAVAEEEAKLSQAEADKAAAEEIKNDNAQNDFIELVADCCTTYGFSDDTRDKALAAFKKSGVCSKDGFQNILTEYAAARGVVNANTTGEPVNAGAAAKKLRSEVKEAREEEWSAENGTMGTVHSRMTKVQVIDQRLKALQGAGLDLGGDLFKMLWDSLAEQGIPPTFLMLLKHEADAKCIMFRTSPMFAKITSSDRVFLNANGYIKQCKGSWGMSHQTYYYKMKRTFVDVIKNSGKLTINLESADTKTGGKKNAKGRAKDKLVIKSVKNSKAVFHFLEENIWNVKFPKKGHA